MAKFSIHKERRGDWDVVRLVGRVDEESSVQLIGLYSGMGKRCIFNFKNVVSINSNGIRGWVLFLRDFQVGRLIELEECVPVVVEQMNMLPSFIQTARVRSVFAEFECLACKTIQDRLVIEADFAAGQAGDLVGGRCKACLGPLTLPSDGDQFTFTGFKAAG